jgi:geranylgeranyl diphosphate synthase type II
MTAKEYLAETSGIVDAALDRWLPSVEAEPRVLHEAMRYSVFAGGKRLRPAIARAACQAAGGRDEDALPAACALEMLHTYSLIHDDLPAIDDDDLRRGRPTCHVRFGVATAILAGDALQTEAFRVLAEETPRRDAVGRLVSTLARAAGTNGMVGGEVADIEAEGQEPELDRVEDIHARKTAALFRASALMGGIAAGAGDDVLAALDAYGQALGLAFQIVDDILDETAGAEQLGKTPGKDRAAKKMSYPAAVGLERSRERARECADEALATLRALGGLDTAILAALVEFATERAS